MICSLIMDLFIALGHKQCIKGKLQALKWENKEFCNSQEANSKSAWSEAQTVHFSASKVQGAHSLFLPSAPKRMVLCNNARSCANLSGTCSSMHTVWSQVLLKRTVLC